jgi:hypothetical protein
MIDKIGLHSGIVVDNVYVANYIVVNDGVRRKHIDKHKNKNQFVISHRFIDYCINNRRYFSMKDHDFIHILPLPHKVPIDCFFTVVIHFEGFNIIEKNILELLAETLGAKVELNR